MRNRRVKSQTINEGRLAKLLATEDVTVRHSVKAKTASFDVVSRVLTLPVWLIDNKDVHDMMTGHEVGHALWTAPDDWATAVKDKDYHPDILNIVEDARIEKKIKLKYPGILTNFLHGYQELVKQRFFFKDPAEILEMGLLDRINLHYKLGVMADIPFEDWEYEYVKMVGECNTWKDVLRVTRILMELLSAQELEQSVSPQFSDAHEWSDMDMDGDSVELPFPTDNEDMDEESNNLPQPNSQSMDEASEKSNEELTENLKDVESTTQNNFDKSSEALTEAIKSQDENEYNAPREAIYCQLPVVMLDKMIIPYKEIQEDFVKLKAHNKWLYNESLNHTNGYRHSEKRVSGGWKKLSYEEHQQNVTESYNKFRITSSKIVNYMVKEFERKKAAREYRKESTSKTGVLDVNKLFSYKYNDDIFLKNIIRPDGKSHGMVMLVDWSASMHNHMLPTLKQIMQLVWFCNKVNIPFRVYGFTASYKEAKASNLIKKGMSDQDRDDYFRLKSPIMKETWSTLKLGNEYTALLELFSSDMNAKALSTMCRNLFSFGEEQVQCNWDQLSLSSTPLLEGLVGINKIIPLFKENYNLDIVNLFVLTDGEANSTPRGVTGAHEGDSPLLNFSWRDVVVENRKTKTSYSTITEAGEIFKYLHSNRKLMLGLEAVIHNMIREVSGANIVGIFLDTRIVGNRYRKGLMEQFIGHHYFHKDVHTACRKGLRKDGFITASYLGYDAFYIVPVGKISDEAGELEFDKDMSAAKIKKVFSKHQSQKFGSKVLVNRMMEIIC